MVDLEKLVKERKLDEIVNNFSVDEVASLLTFKKGLILSKLLYAISSSAKK